MRQRHVAIVGGGISGLAALERLAREVVPDGPLRVTLLESATRVGGVIRTDGENGFVMEAGPDVMLAAKPAAVALCEELGLSDRLIETRPSAKGSFILAGGRLHRMPEGMTGVVPSRFAPFALSPLLSPLGKLRVALDLLLPPRRGDDDETVESFVVRRLGREMYENLIEPLLSGIFAGDGARLSIGATFPQLRAMETEHGGLVRGMLAARRAAARRSAVTAPPARRRPTGLVSLLGGLGELVGAIERRVESHPAASRELRILRGATVTRIDRRRDGAGYSIVRESGGPLAADAVIVAAPGHVAARLVRPLDDAIATLLEGIEYASTVTINIAYRAADVPLALQGTGYTVPRIQGRPVLACTFTSNKFEERAPDGYALFRIFLGGANRGDFVQRADAELIDLARAELREVLGITASPVQLRVNRFANVMAQYNLGHVDRVSEIERRLGELPGLALAGNAYRGVGIPDCIRSGQSAAEATLKALAAEAGRAPAVGATEPDVAGADQTSSAVR